MRTVVQIGGLTRSGAEVQPDQSQRYNFHSDFNVIALRRPAVTFSTPDRDCRHAPVIAPSSFSIARFVQAKMSRRRA
jgi:hypothetical protein